MIKINPGGYTIGTLTGYQHISATPSPTSPPTPTASPPSPTDQDETEDLHIRYKRGFNFGEADAEQDSALWPTTIGATEISYSKERNGDTSVYVKTTRPIVRLCFCDFCISIAGFSLRSQR